MVNPQESLYSSLTWSDNDSVITIVLKPWKWSDGAPITARDFTFVYNLLKANYNDWEDYDPGLFPADVTKVATPNAHTVVIHLNRSYNPSFYTDDVLSEVPLLPQHAWDKTSLTGTVGNYDETTAGADGGVELPAEAGLGHRHLRHQPDVAGGGRAVEAGAVPERRLLRLGAEQELLRPRQAAPFQGHLHSRSPPTPPRWTRCAREPA